MRCSPSRPPLATALASCMAALVAALVLVIAGPGSTARAAGEPDWLVVVNRYRAVAGLGPVVENPEASAGAAAHSNYLVCNRVIGHDESSSSPAYTEIGLRAGMTGNVATGSGRYPTQRALIEGWMTAPFHGLGMIRPQSTAFGFGVAGTARSYASTLSLFWEDYIGPGHEGGPDFEGAFALVVQQHPELADEGWDISGTDTLLIVSVGTRRFEVKQGVVRELGPADSVGGTEQVITWPGNGTAVPLVRYSGSEYPEPLTSCPGFGRSAGLPVLLRRGIPTEVAKASMTDSSGAAQTLCVLTANTYVNRDPVAMELARGLLGDDGAVVLIPRKPLVRGRSYAMDVTLTDGARIQWSFAVSPTSAIGLPAGHPLANAPLPGVSSQLTNTGK